MALELNTKLPRTIGQYILFFNWEMDEWALFFIPLVLSIPTRQLWIGIAIGAFLMSWYGKMKRTKPSGFVVHFLASKGLIQFKKLPPVHISEFRS